MGKAILVITFALGACGRIDFDPVAADTGSTTGSSFVLSTTQLTTSTLNSWVDLEVDWGRKLAYIATRETGVCFSVVDFSSTPTLVTSVGPPRTASSPCLGVALDATGTKLLVTSSRVELWDLGADPRAGNYTQLASLAVTQPRRITRDPSNPDRVYVARGAGAPGFQVVQVTSASPWLTLGGSYNAAGACADSYDDAVALASGKVLTACAVDGSPAEIVDANALTVTDTIPALPPVAGTSGFWSAARSPDGTFAMMAGWVTVAVDSAGAPGYTLDARFDNASCYRGLAYTDRGNGAEVWGTRDDGVVDMLSVRTATDPVVIGRADLTTTTTGAVYGIEVAPVDDRAVMITNRGYFIVGQPSMMPATSDRWPAF